MPRYAAFLRAVSPTNAKMPRLKAAFEAAGFTDVRTVLASGNVTFTAPPATESSLESRARAAMKDVLGHDFLTLVRPIEALRALLAADPYADFGVPRHAKRVVTFLRGPPQPAMPLPTECDGARLLCVKGREAFSAYVPGPKGPVFMRLIEKAFGREQTTRTWDTVAKVARVST